METRLPLELPDQPIIVFDGECVLCSRFFRFVIRHDRAGQFRYVIAQSGLGTRVYQALDLPIDDYETNLVIIGGRVYQKANAFAAAMRALGWPWRVLALILYAPPWPKNPAYRWIARNRYRIWGRRESCMIPSPDLVARFLPGGWEKAAE